MPEVPDVPVTADLGDPDIDTGECPPGVSHWVTGCLPLQYTGLKDAALMQWIQVSPIICGKMRYQ